MNRPYSASLPALGVSSVSPWLRNVAVVLAGSAFVALCSHIALPLWFTPVPLTMQPFAVLLLGLVLTPRLAAATLVAYLAEGALGLPVFAPGLGLGLGFAHLAGPTGGYLLSYPAAAAVIALLLRRTSRGFAAALAAATIGNVLILGCGFLWMAVWTHASVGTTFFLSVVPFLPGDALKVAAAAGITAGTRRFYRRQA